MDPNSTHQLWSRWTATVTLPAPDQAPLPSAIKYNCARFYRKAFGAATELNLTYDTPHRRWVIDCRSEGHPAHDPAYVAYMEGQLLRFLQNGFGSDAEITFDVRLEAGSRQDGSPADQLIMGPEPVVLDNLLLRER